jgi:hypothetical protein
VLPQIFRSRDLDDPKKKGMHPQRKEGPLAKKIILKKHFVVL